MQSCSSDEGSEKQAQLRARILREPAQVLKGFWLSEDAKFKRENPRWARAWSLGVQKRCPGTGRFGAGFADLLLAWSGWTHCRRGGLGLGWPHF